jgi:hypothetical protein
MTHYQGTVPLHRLSRPLVRPTIWACVDGLATAADEASGAHVLFRDGLTRHCFVVLGRCHLYVLCFCSWHYFKARVEIDEGRC